MQASFHPALVPDPFMPLLGEEGSPGALLDRQRRRGAAILAATRRLLAEDSERLTVRAVADTCGVTVQTLRNMFGRREELLVAAFNDHTSAVWRALASFSAGPFLFLDLAQVYHRCAVAHPAFLRAMVTSAVASIGPLALAQRHGSGLKSRHLHAMARSEVLRERVDPQALASHITRLNTFMMYEWACGDDAAGLRRAMIDGNRLLLLGAATPRAAAAIEAWEPALAA